jgi:hypothetical protein
MLHVHGISKTLVSPFHLKLCSHSLLHCAGILTLAQLVWPLRLSFEIFLEVSMIPYLLRFVCWQNQHHMDNADVDADTSSGS